MVCITSPLLRTYLMKLYEMSKLLHKFCGKDPNICYSLGIQKSFTQK